jgi:hypothetical protein
VGLSSCPRPSPGAKVPVAQKTGEGFEEKRTLNDYLSIVREKYDKEHRIMVENGWVKKEGLEAIFD